MNRKKKITPITEEDFQKVINNSVMGEGSRLVGSAAEQKKLFVKPIAAIDDGENVMQYVQRLAEETEETIEEIEEEIDRLVDDTQKYYDERLETEKKNVPDAINEVLGIANKKVTKETVPNRIYGTDAHGRPKMYELNEVGDIIGGESEIGDIFQFVQELPQEGMKNVLYFVLKTDGEDKDLFDEWVWANKGTSEEPIYDWEFVGTKKISIDTSLFVKFTDYANESKGGVIRAYKTYGFNVNANGIPNAEVLSKQKYDSVSQVAFIAKGTLDNIKYTYVKGGLVDNTEEWTDDDKAKACETIGAVRTPNTTVYGSYVIQYVVTENGKVGVIGEPIKVQGSVGANTIPLRDKDGALYGAVPTTDTGLIPKKYAEDNFVAKLTYESTYPIVYIKNANGTQGTLAVTNAPFGGGVVQRYNSGHIHVPAVPTSDVHATSKKYVDDAIANIEVGGGGGGGTDLFTHRVGCYVYDEINSDTLEAVLIFANTDDTPYVVSEPNPDAVAVDVPPELISVFEDPSTSPNFVSLWIIEDGKYIATRMNVYEGRVYIEIARGEGITYLILNGVMYDDVTDFGG